MVDAVQLYMDAIGEDLKAEDQCWVEMPLLTALQQVDPEMGGTADFVRYRPSTKHLRVWDFKFGSGTYVEAEDNEQMKIYGLGAMLETNALVHEVTLSICQPRFEGAAPVRDFHFKAIEILEFVAQIQEAAARTRLPNPPLVAGEHCKSFCPNARTCPELEKLHHAVIGAEFSSTVPYNPVALASALAALPLVKERIKAIEGFAYSEAAAGREIPGFKLVDKRPTRRFKSAGDVISHSEHNGVDCWKPREMLSPAQLEKEFGKNGKKELAQFIESVSSGTTLVPVTDDRPAAKLISVDDFTVIDGTAKNSTTPPSLF